MIAVFRFASLFVFFIAGYLLCDYKNKQEQANRDREFSELVSGIRVELSESVSGIKATHTILEKKTHEIIEKNPVYISDCIDDDGLQIIEHAATNTIR